MSAPQHLPKFRDIVAFLLKLQQVGTYVLGVNNQTTVLYRQVQTYLFDGLPHYIAFCFRDVPLISKFWQSGWDTCPTLHNCASKIYHYLGFSIRKPAFLDDNVDRLVVNIYGLLVVMISY